MPWDMKPASSSRFCVDSCFGLGRSLQVSLYHEGLFDVKKWMAYMVHTFASIEEELSGGINLLSWQFLRRGASLALLLSLLQAGIAAFSHKYKEGPVQREDFHATQGGLLEFLAEYVKLLLNDGAIIQLLKHLSLLLRSYVDAAHSSVAAVLSDSPSHGVLAATDLLLRGLPGGRSDTPQTGFIRNLASRNYGFVSWSIS